MREFAHDNISLRAGALTFTIILSLVPTLALGTAVLKGLGAGDQMRQAAYQFIDSLESAPRGSEETPPGPRDEELQKPEAGEKLNTSDAALPGHLKKATNQIFNYVDRTDFATLGAFGVLGLVFSVLSVLGSIEQSMNVIWQAKSGRPFGRKLMDYLALMILLPLSVNLALATETTLQNKTLFKMVNDLLPIVWLTALLLKILPMLLVVGTFTILYRFLPNTTVRFLPALVGGSAGFSPRPCMLNCRSGWPATMQFTALLRRSRFSLSGCTSAGLFSLPARKWLLPSRCGEATPEKAKT
jgi:membrane protein